MRHRSQEQRREIVTAYFAAPLGKRSSVLEHYGVSSSTFSRWVAAGKPPLADRRTYSLDFKVAVLRDLRDSGESQSQVAARHGIHWALLSQWANGRGPSARAAVEKLQSEGAQKPKKTRGTSVALAVQATQEALTRMNGPQPDGAVAANTLIREVLLRLRSLGIHLEQVTVNGDRADIAYTVKETIDL